MAGASSAVGPSSATQSRFGGGGNFDWQTLATALASGVENYQQQRATERAQEDVFAGQLAAQAEQRKADQRVSDLVNRLKTSGPEPLVRENLANYTAAIRASRGANNPSLPGNVGGERFQTGVAEGSQQGLNYADQYANTVARLDAPMYQRRAEAEDAARAGIDIRGFADRAQTEQYLAQLRASRRQPDPIITTLARLGQQFARNYQPKVESDGLEYIDPSTIPKRKEPFVPVSQLLKPIPDWQLQEIDLNTIPQKIDPYLYAIQHPTMRPAPDMTMFNRLYLTPTR